jgi:prophage tail gpP-like protein
VALYKDEVALTLGGDTLRVTQQYEVKTAILRQPAGFSIRLGHGGVVAEFLKRYPPNTPFSLSINGNTIQTGNTDGASSGEGGGASEVTYEGRDALAPVIKSCVRRDRSFQNTTYHDLVAAIFDEIGLTDYTIRGDNTANRRAITGKVTVETKPAEIVIATFATKEAEIREVIPGTTKTTYKSETARIGTRWYDWLKTRLDRAGIFLWAAGDGTFILSRPNKDQSPIARITRIARGERGEGRVVQHSHRQDVSNVYTKVIVSGHGGGGKNFGRTKNYGEFVNPWAAQILGGENRQVLTIHDNDCKSPESCVHLARRRVAEMNRDAWQLSYLMAGHSTQAIGGGRAVWAADTIVEVDDRETGIAGLFYVEGVTFARAPHTTTLLRLMRPEDLVFATEAEAA